MRTPPLDVGIDDLDLVLGGGLFPFVRVEGALPSATVLIRGPAGSGKTLFASHIAVGAAKSLDADIAYACVELLPRELEAQLRHFGGRVADVRFALNGVVADEAGDKPTMIVSSLDLERDKPDPTALLEAVDAIAREATLTRAAVRVFVVDSLSVGYGLGADTARYLCDELCKLAGERGWILLLLEESDSSEPSAWSYAVDTVLQLRVEDDGARTLRIPKHRFGRPGAGAHRLQFLAEDCAINPSLQTYSSRWVRDRALPELVESPPREWHAPGGSRAFAGWRDYRDATIGVWGSDPLSLRRVVRLLGVLPKEHAACPTLYVDFQLRTERQSSAAREFDAVLPAGHPQLSGPTLLLAARKIIEAIGTTSAIQQVVVGDLQALLDFEHADELGHALMILASLCRDRSIPVVFFETAAPRRRFDPPDSQYAVDTLEPLPFAARLADVHVEVRDAPASQTQQDVLVRDLIGLTEVVFTIEASPRR